MLSADSVGASQDEHASTPFHARLFGGNGDGLAVQLSALEPRISVYRNGGPAVGVGDDRGDVRGTFLGVYEMVGPVGPEGLVYVPVEPS